MAVGKTDRTVIEENKELFERRRMEAAQYLARESRAGKPIVGAYCCYAPTEMVYAMGGIPVGLCGMSQIPIPVAERKLPANTCPLVKSSFGFIESGTCPFFESADAVIAETTCDAKKKMYEYIGHYKPFHLIELPQIPDREAAMKHWLDELKRLKRFLEGQFRKRITSKRLEAAIKLTNRRRRLRRKLYDYTKTFPPVVSGGEIHRLFDVYAAGEDYDRHLEKVLEELERRRQAGEVTAGEDAPRVLMTGCPLGGDAEKVIEEIEGAGGVIVVNEACSGIKPLLDLVAEDTGDPLRAVAERYLKLPCSVMTPNDRRLEVMDELIDEFKPDCVIDVILTACHTYNLESHKIMELVQKKHGLPFLKIETDYSEADRGQMRIRIDTLMEMVRDRREFP